MADWISIASKFEWVIHGLLILLLIYVAAKLVGREPIDAFFELLREVQDLVARKRSVGGINMLLCLFLALLGFVLIGITELHAVLALLAERIGADRAAFAAKSANVYSLFYVLAAVVCVSLVCVVIDGRGRKK